MRLRALWVEKFALKLLRRVKPGHDTRIAWTRLCGPWSGGWRLTSSLLNGSSRIDGTKIAEDFVIALPELQWRDASEY